MFILEREPGVVTFRCLFTRSFLFLC